MCDVKAKAGVLLVGAVMMLAGCVTRPLGPTVAVFPSPSKPFEVFQDDQAICENYADHQIAGGAEAANNRAIGATVLGTALGAAVGAATGSGRGTAAGAAIGGVAGTGVGAGIASRSQYALQQRYNIAYSQCMYAKGNQVAGFSAPLAPPPLPPPRG